jgi:type VI secretion system protein
MRERRLLERLRAIEQDPNWRGESDPKGAVRSVLDHLGKILNTRQDSAPISPDLGVPDFTALASSFGTDSVPEIEEAITRVIRKYEPRLANIQVSFDARPDRAFSIAFKLTASIAVEGRQAPVVFETVLNPDGRISVLE